MTTQPERIHGWQDSRLSIARFYGGITYQAGAKQQEQLI